MNTSNSFSVAGRLAADAKVTNLTTSHKASARIAVTYKKDDKTTTGWMNIEAYRKDDKEFDALKKGQLIQFNGFFRPDEYDDKEGKHQQIIVLVATSWEPVTFEAKEEKGAE